MAGKAERVGASHSQEGMAGETRSGRAWPDQAGFG